MKLILTVGVPASGKTTWAEKYCEDTGAVNVNRDETRQKLFGPFKWGEYNFAKDKEQLVSKTNVERAIVALRNGNDVVVSDTNLNPDFRNVWKGIAKEHGAEYEEKLFHIDFEEANKRDQAREMSVGKKVLTNMLLTYHRLNRDLIVAHFKELLEKTWENATEIVVLSDIDGTVAEMHKGVKGKRSPYEWKRVGEDTPRENVLYNLKVLSKDYPVWFMSGRDGSCQEETVAWLDEHAPFYTDVIMRLPSDSRPDWVVKLELLHELALNGLKPLVMFDDRNQVVDTLREVGVEVWQVQPGNF